MQNAKSKMQIAPAFDATGWSRDVHRVISKLVLFAFCILHFEF